MNVGWVVCCVVAAGCVHSNSVQCSDRVCPEGTACDEIHSSCVAPDQLKSCIGLADGAGCEVGSVTPGLCHDQVCLPADCGDGFLQFPELCDGNELGDRPDCVDHGFYDSKPVSCNNACNYVTTSCTGYCGDGMINGAELCDGAPPAQTCTDFGYGAGFLDCNQCGPGLADCKQFGWRSEYVGVEQLADIHGTSDTNIWAVGDASTVLRRGQTGWQKVDVSACVPSPTTYDLVGVWALDDDDAIAVGNNTGASESVSIRISATGCTLATIASTPVQDIWGFGPDDVYAAGTGIHHFDGTSWSSTNTGTLFFGLWGASASDLYAIAGNSTMLHWNGTAWSPTANAPPVTGPLRYITGRTPNDLWIQANDFDGTIRYLRYDGTSWTIESSMTDYTTALASIGGRVFRWDAGGEVFAYDADARDPAGLGSITNTGGAKRALWGTPTGRVMAASASGRIQSYEGQELDLHAASLGPVFGMTAVRGRAEIRSSAGTQTWNGVALFNDGTIPAVFDVWLDPATADLYVLEADGLHHRAKTDTTFPASPDVALANAYALYGRAANDLWILIGGSGDVRRWDGAQLTCGTCTLPGVSYIAGSASDDMFAVGAGGMIQHWNGSTWSAQVSPTSIDLHGVSAASATDAWAVGDAGTVLHYDGTAWSKVDVGSPFIFFSVWAFASDDVFIGGVAGTILHYDGVHWSPVRSPTDELVQEMVGVGDVLYMADDFGRLLRLIRTRPW